MCEHIFHCFVDICVEQLHLVWRCGWKGLHMGLENNKIVQQVQGPWQCVYKCSVASTWDIQDGNSRLGWSHQVLGLTFGFDGLLGIYHLLGWAYLPCFYDRIAMTHHVLGWTCLPSVVIGLDCADKSWYGPIYLVLWLAWIVLTYPGMDLCT